MTTRRFDRRTFLRGSGVALALPLLESLPVGQTFLSASEAAAPAAPRRLIAVCTTLGIHAENLFPRQVGRDYTLTPYLEVLRDFRNDLTLFSGLSHPDVDGGHSSEVSFLTAAPRPGSASFRNSISLDQYAVERLRHSTRFPALVLAPSGGSLSYSRSGVQIPPDSRPSAVFARLFLNGSRQQVEQQVRRLRDGRSILDTVQDRARRLQSQVSPADRDRLDQYFTAVREVEVGLASAQEWARRPKPQVQVPPPRDITDPADTVGKARLMFDLAHLAFQTDSTRIITLRVQGANRVPPIEGVTIDHHNLSHHGMDPAKLDQLRLVETRQMEAVRDFLVKLRQTREGGQTLLDRTMVLYGSNLGNASSHDTRNLPVLLAGGGFRHGQHLAFDRRNNTALGKVYVAMLQRLGVETDTFASGRGRISGLEFA